jgi:DNA-binding NarL/FixJ family response regulator
VTEAPARDIRVFVVEDLPAVRDALRMLLNGTPGMSCAGVAADAEQALQALPDASPDVVLLDIELPGMSGIDALMPLKRLWPTAEILMLTIHDAEERVFAALCAGATGYLLKSVSPPALIDAIREVHAGGAPMSASVARQVVRTFRRGPEHDGLSAREQEVLDALIGGKTYRQIGEGLFISVNTVAFHVKQIYQKLHVHSRAEAAALSRPVARAASRRPPASR